MLREHELNTPHVCIVTHPVPSGYRATRRPGEPDARSRSGRARRLRIVSEVRGEPALDRLDRNALPSRVVLDLITREASHREVARLRVSQVDAAHARRREHGERLR